MVELQLSRDGEQVPSPGEPRNSQPSSPSSSVPSVPRRLSRVPPSLRDTLSQTALVFPPFENGVLLQHLPSSLILPARVSSASLAHSVILHIRCNALLIFSNGGNEQAVLTLPPHSVRTFDNIIEVSNITKKPLFIRPSQDAIGPLLRALRPEIPSSINICRRLAERVFIASLKHRKVAVKLFGANDIPDYAVPTRAVLQRVRGEGVIPLLAAIQGRGYCGLVMPICPDLRSYVERFGKLSIADGRGVIAGIVKGISRLDDLGGAAGEFGADHVLLHAGSAVISRAAYSDALQDQHRNLSREKVWKETVTSVVSIIRECCETGDKGEDFVKGCEDVWSVDAMREHPWVIDAPTPKLRKMRLGSTKDLGEIPRRIGSGTRQGISGWEFVHR